jgi:muramoyltetrapeptide carboxypeptidase
MLHPAHAPPGSVVLVVGPSGPFDEETLKQGLLHLHDYDVRFEPELIGRHAGFLAGSDEARRLELQRALDSSEARAIWLARGGYGLGRIAHQLDWSGFVQTPKWILGFSDGTVLHQACSSRGIASLHGPNVTSLAPGSEADITSLRLALAGKPQAVVRSLRCEIPGRAVGPLIGGNLTVLCMLAAAGHLALPAGALLVLEDVDETSYRVDRMLTALILGHHLDGVAAIVLGDFTNCSPGRFEVPVEDVLLRTLAPLGVPLVFGFPTGHGARRQTWVHGGRAELDAGACTLTSLG